MLRSCVVEQCNSAELCKSSFISIQYKRTEKKNHLLFQYTIGSSQQWGNAQYVQDSQTDPVFTLHYTSFAYHSLHQDKLKKTQKIEMNDGLQLISR